MALQQKMSVVMSLEDWIKCFVLLVAVLYIGDQSVLRRLDEMFCIISGSLVQKRTEVFLED